MAGRTSFGRAGDDGKDGVFEGRHAFPHLADGLDGRAHRGVADGNAEAGGGVRSAAVGAAADGVADVPGAGSTASTGGGAGEAWRFCRRAWGG